MGIRDYPIAQECQLLQELKSLQYCYVYKEFICQKPNFLVEPSTVEALTLTPDNSPGMET